MNGIVSHKRRMEGFRGDAEDRTQKTMEVMIVKVVTGMAPRSSVR